MDEYLDRLRRHTGDLRRITNGLDETALAQRVQEGKWSLHELVCHLCCVQQVFQARIETVLAQDNPAIASYSPDLDPEFDKLAASSPGQVIAGFLVAREQLLARLSLLTENQWSRPGRHPEFPAYSVAFQVEYMMHHEASHLCQMYMRRLKL